MKNSSLSMSAVIAIAGASILFSSKSASADQLSVANIVAKVTINSDAGTMDVTDITVKNSSENAADTETISEFILPTISAGQGNPGDAVTNVALFDDASGNSAGNCYLDLVLGKGDSCTLELAITVTGVAPVGNSGPASKTDLVNHLDDTTVSVTYGENNASSLSNTANFDVDVQYAPEPGSLVLLGSGMLGLAGVLRRKLGRG